MIYFVIYCLSVHDFCDVEDMNIDEHLHGVVFAKNVCVTFDNTLISAHIFLRFFNRRNVKDAPVQ